MKPLVIYHNNCADGFGAAFAAWLKFGDEAEYIPMQYGFHVDDLDNIPYQGNEVYMVDFSWPKPLMDNLFEKARKVVWLDHHKTAFEMWLGGIPDVGIWREDNWHAGATPRSRYILLDNNKSGAMIAWEYFHPDKEIPMLIRHIDDYDRWQFKLEGTKEFNKALWSYAPWSFEQWERRFVPSWLIKNVKGAVCCGGESTYAPSYKTKIGNDTNLYTDGAAILRAHDQNVQAVIKGAGRNCRISFINPWGVEPLKPDGTPQKEYFGLAANCPPHLAFDVGHQLAIQSGTFGLLWYINKDGKCLCSLRSNGDYDVSAIAKVFGGGGHKNAAGFEVSIEQLLEWMK